MNLTEIKTALSDAEEPTAELLKKLYDYCDDKGEEPESVISKTFVKSKLSAKAWTDFASATPYQRKSKSVKKLQYASVTNDLIASALYPVRQHPSHILYTVVDEDQKLLGKAINYDAVTNTTLTNISHALNAALARRGDDPRYLEVKAVKEDMFAYFATHCEDNPPPVIYAQPDDDVYCLARRTVMEDDQMAMPDWSRFLAGFEDPEAFAAKLWAIATGNDTSRQALVVRSDGKTGKSCALNAFATIFGDSAKALSGASVNQSSRFIASNYINSALIYVPDTNSRTILLTDTVKMLTGSDTVQYEVKFGAFGEYKAEAKLIVFMNPRPLVLAEEHSVSRCLYLEQHQVAFEDIGADAYTKRLTDQLPAFLAYGRKCFAHKWQKNKIILNDKAQATFDLLVGSERQEFYDWLCKYFVLDDSITDEMNSQMVSKALDKVKGLSKHDRAQWREWLEDLPEITVRRTQRQTYYCGIAQRSAALRSASSGMGDA